MVEHSLTPTQKASIGHTAYMTAAARAHESQRPDCLFHDPWAAKLAGAEGERRFHQLEDAGGSIIVRTRFFDEFLQRTVNQWSIRQIVMPACGLDTRAFRLSWPADTVLFELDQPDLLRYKEGILQAQRAQPGCQRRLVAVDLIEDSWPTCLLEAGYDPSRPSLWLIEGLLFYLPHKAILQLLELMSSLSAPHSWLAFDAIHSAMTTSPLTQQRIERVARLGVPWIGTIDDPVALLASLGWQATVTSSARKGYEYNRPVYPFIARDQLTPDMERLYHWLVTAVRQSQAPQQE
ncbi:S-adenosyl-L-methionine-dependent methyltransferase [Thermogemmatispora aurantia]|uniref:S-adenosyl-L-methionine-dependent methyltransferase n=1 Tax=Thermogemmatispora aurantia TaxID=2045279 RepID=A0A5J4K6R3_9CHLR|nr:SAM-dependent methyltransferase [Thermogemmatispora aurantia]GER82379.1 S-adenosyl-L-methionine-dependent methyltransferase [Thermogemmatispora aurantia]